ncbi:MAG: hypothetical protein WD491_14155 [Balneolales bacterium]
MKAVTFNILLFLILSVVIQACGPSADEIRQKEQQETRATQRLVEEEVMVYEAMELIQQQSLLLRKEKI